MRTKMKSLLCLFLCLLMTISALSGLSMKASAASRTGTELLDTKTTAASKTYVLTAMDYYFAQNPSFASSTVVFMFEGASKSPAAYAFGGVRNQAIAVVVKNGAITYVEGNCSTIPDNPEKNYGTSPSAPTILDGTYKLVSKNHKGEYAAFNVQTTGNSGSLPCVRLNKSAKTYTQSPAATAINLHTRGSGSAASENSSSPMSAGCLLAGLTSNFCTLINKISGKSFSSGEKWSSSDLGKFYAYLVIDRQLAIQGLNGFVYGNYSGALNEITAASSSASGGAGSAAELPAIAVDEIGVTLLGKSHSITGTVTSPTNITKVTGQFLCGETVKKTVEITPNAKSVTLKNTAINNNLKFGELACGNYELRITATNAAGTISKSVYFTVDMVTIGHAKTGKSTPGDQDGKEVFTENWYNSPWKVVIRATDPAVAEKIAYAMQQACDNNNIGYPHGDTAADSRTSCYKEAKKVSWDLSKITNKCSADCSALVAVCVNAAGITVDGGMYTGNEQSLLMATGQFEVFTTTDYTEHVMNLKRGDILLRAKTSTKGGHTAVVLTNGCNVTDDPIEETPVTERPTITIQAIGTVTYGNSHPVAGKVSSPTNLTSVKGEFLQGETVVQTYTVTTNAKTLDLQSSAINTNLKFGKLSAGVYTMKITAVNAAGTTEESVDFTVTSNLTISVGTIGSVTCGKSYNITGTVSSAAKLTSVKGEFLSGSTVLQSVTVNPNAKSLILKSSNINKNLKFGKLAKGTYILRITAVDAAGETKVSEQTFKIV